MRLPQTTITSAQSLPAGAFNPPFEPIEDLPAICRVQGSIKSAKDSEIQFEVWMPSSGWNRRFLGVGNDAFAGTINFHVMAVAAHNGYATASTDGGHRADNGIRAGHCGILSRWLTTATARFTR
jgi:hypothetical protein